MIREKTAIVESLKMWIWLYQNPGKGKEDYPDFLELHKKYHSDCLCCVYFFKMCKTIKGKQCPLRIDWGNACGNNAYIIWQYYNRNHKPAAAYIASKLRRYARKKGWM